METAISNPMYSHMEDDKSTLELQQPQHRQNKSRKILYGIFAALMLNAVVIGALLAEVRHARTDAAEIVDTYKEPVNKLVRIGQTAAETYAATVEILNPHASVPQLLTKLLTQDVSAAAKAVESLSLSAEDSSCPFVANICKPPDCNVCAECCQAYIPEGKACDDCTAQQCESGDGGRNGDDDTDDDFQGWTSRTKARIGFAAAYIAAFARKVAEVQPARLPSPVVAPQAQSASPQSPVVAPQVQSADLLTAAPTMAPSPEKETGPNGLLLETLNYAQAWVQTQAANHKDWQDLAQACKQVFENIENIQWSGEISERRRSCPEWSNRERRWELHGVHDMARRISTVCDVFAALG